MTEEKFQVCTAEKREWERGNMTNVMKIKIKKEKPMKYTHTPPNDITHPSSSTAVFPAITSVQLFSLPNSMTESIIKRRSATCLPEFPKRGRQSDAAGHLTVRARSLGRAVPADGGMRENQIIQEMI